MAHKWSPDSNKLQFVVCCTRWNEIIEMVGWVYLVKRLEHYFFLFGNFKNQPSCKKTFSWPKISPYSQKPYAIRIQILNVLLNVNDNLFDLVISTVRFTEIILVFVFFITEEWVCVYLNVLCLLFCLFPITFQFRGLFIFADFRSFERNLHIFFDKILVQFRRK